MHRRIKTRLKTAGAVLLLLAIVAVFVPLFEVDSKYCFYCGRESLSFRVFGLHVPWPVTEKNIYRDSLIIPEHAHRMIVCNGSRIWAFKGQAFWDEFGWTGKPFRKTLQEALERTPEHEQTIIGAYLRIDPDDREGAQRFLDKYGSRNPKP